MSTAYYALFHLLVEDAANALSPSTPATLRKLVRRAFQHGSMKATCKEFVQANAASSKNNRSALPLNVEAMLTFPLEADLIIVMTAFVRLQEARHKADYDVTEQFNRLDVLNDISAVRIAFASWLQIRKSQNAAIFMSSLLVGRDWRR